MAKRIRHTRSTLLVVGEGDTEVAFLRHLRVIFCSACKGVEVTIRNAYGKGPENVINTVIGHLWHVVPGSHFRRMYGADANPHTYELMEQTADHFHWDQGEVWSDIRKIGVSPTTDKAGGGHAHHAP